MIKISLITVFFIVLALVPDPSAHAINGRGHGKNPYGGYCPGPGRGWYGAKKSVKTSEEAREILLEYFKGDNVIVGEIKEREWIFEVEIKDKENKVIDIVIVHKRTGRIRSIY